MNEPAVDGKIDRKIDRKIDGAVDRAIDPRRLDAIRARHEGGHLLNATLSAYLEQAARLEIEIGEAVNAGDPSAVRETAGALKSLSAEVGAMRVSALCARLETEGWPGYAAPLFDRLVAALRESSGVLTEVLRSDAA